MNIPPFFGTVTLGEKTLAVCACVKEKLPDYQIWRKLQCINLSLI